MPKFFMESVQPVQNGDFNSELLTITGDDAAHISRVLRMKAGEHITVCDCRGFDYICEILETSAQTVPLKVLERCRRLLNQAFASRFIRDFPKATRWILLYKKVWSLALQA